jgi:hypothetical protein
MSTTPRTDAQVRDYGSNPFVSPDFARTLELELAGFCRELGANPALEPSGQVADAMVRLFRLKASAKKLRLLLCMVAAHPSVQAAIAPAQFAEVDAALEETEGI